MQEAFIHALTATTTADARVRAAWLAGSFGKGIADRYSDVDAHLLIEADKLAEFQQGVREWLEEVRPLVLYRLMFGGQMVNAMTEDALRLDIWLHGDEIADVIEGEAQILYAEDGALNWQPNPGSQMTHEAAAQELNRAIPEFWRCVSMLPVPLGRDEKLIGAAGNFLITLLLTDVLSVQSGIRKDRGVKALNSFLPSAYREMVEEIVYLPELTHDALARYQLRLVRIMREYGPAICEQWDVDYPQALEDATLNYVRRELQDMGLDAALEELEE